MRTKNNAIVKEFLEVKRLEGCSDNTIKNYRGHLHNMIEGIDPQKCVLEYTTIEIRLYLVNYKNEHNISNVSLDNMRRVINSFYTYLFNNGHIGINPCVNIAKIKHEKVVKKPFTEEELEKLRDACKTPRDKALVEFLYSSGVRVGELCNLNISDIDFNTNSCVVTGKGNKQRVVYLSARAVFHLKNYLEYRNDDNEALFVGLIAPHGRLSVSGVERSLHKIGAAAEVEDVHPHKFRHTCATMLQRRGMPIEEVSKLLGHSQLETTMIYVDIDQSQIQAHHKKYI